MNWSMTMMVAKRVQNKRIMANDNDGGGEIKQIDISYMFDIED